MTGPKFLIILWKCWGIEEKPKQVNQIHCSWVYEASKPMRRVLEDLLERLNSDFKNLLKVEYDILWSQIKLFVQQNTKVGISIKYLQADEQLDSATAGTWLKEFVSKRLGTNASLQAGILNICFVVDAALILVGNSSSLFSRQLVFSARPSTALASKRKSFSAQASSSHQSRTLKSAFQISSVTSSRWSCEVSLTDYRFTCLTAKYQPSGDVKILRLDQLETIAIVEHWLEGEKLSKEKKHYKTGFIGHGFTKLGIYEYVVTQPFDDNMSFLAVREVLITKFKLLAQCDGIKQKFDEFIQDAGIEGVPYLFYGEIEPLSASGCRTIPYLSFLATLLLPCGHFDDPIQKFTGSDNLGPANDNLTQAIHAFLLFCDMQGIHDRKNIMCLIDPQAHITNPHDEFTIYWDGGANKIATWKEQHLLALPSDAGRAVDGLCKENWVCSILELSMIEMEDLNDKAGPGLPSTMAEKAKIGYVLNN
ncbi:hypothetical protein BYT27DRAFT_7277825 [Phlegmacium glaucopus]|nr:hypothetical protein BYT27DRAFT_7277825 [Phlegmacium glaucopus]